MIGRFVIKACVIALGAALVVDDVFAKQHVRIALSR